MARGNGSVIEMSNRREINTDIAAVLTSTRSSLTSHVSSSNSSAHGINNISGLQTALDGKSDVGHTHNISDVVGLQTALDDKADTFTGFTGSVTVVTGVDFVGETVTTQTLTYNNGVLTSVV